jgi:hypothetical protein
MKLKKFFDGCLDLQLRLKEAISMKRGRENMLKVVMSNHMKDLSKKLSKQLMQKKNTLNVGMQ